jgi:hypothetical protein
MQISDITSFQKVNIFPKMPVEYYQLVVNIFLSRFYAHLAIKGLPNILFF